MQLNQEQQQAVGHRDGPCVVIAVPGSGKTAVLTQRVIRLIKDAKVSPEHILCITFTNKAANEMKERIAQSIGDLSNRVWVSTFHRLFLAILRKYSDLVGLQPNFSIYDENDQIELISKIARMHGLDAKKPQLYTIAKAANDFREDLHTIEESTAGLSSIEQSVMQEYLQSLEQFNAVDFSGILYKTHQLLQRKPGIAGSLSKRFKYILGDEWQDTNVIQYETVKSISAHGNIFVVGDAAQGIFGFRGARPENLMRVAQDFENCKIIALPRNYRSTSQILSSAERLIHHNSGMENVKLISVAGDGEPICMQQYATPENESDAVASIIYNLHRDYGYKWSDFAILYRTNQRSKLPEMSLRRNGIPYKVYGGFSFFDRAEIKNTLAYLSFLCNPADTIAFARAIKIPGRNIGVTIIGKLERQCQIKKCTILEACQNADYIKGITTKGRAALDRFVAITQKYQQEIKNGTALSQIVNGYIRDIGFYEYMKDESEKDEDFRRRVDNIDELLLSIADFEHRKPAATLQDYLHTVDLLTSEIQDDEDDAVTLLTCHSAKGLEFTVVFMIGMEQGVFPHNRSIAEGGIEEERRLCYVGVTRSRKKLFLSFAKYRKLLEQAGRRCRTIACEPSEFLENMGLFAECVD